MHRVDCSFIVPVYNVIDYIDDCVSSILKMAKRSSVTFEVILVDDGSTDGSGRRCDGLAEQYPSYIQCLHKLNGGLSEARNVGIDAARGIWLFFVDSDDYVDMGFSPYLEQIAKSNATDLFLLRADKVFPSGKKERLDQVIDRARLYQKDSEEVLGYLASLDKMPVSACSKAINRRLFEQNDLKFKVGLLSEDVEWSIRLFNAAERYDIIQVPYYSYRQNREGSITNTVSKKNLYDILNTIKIYGVKKARKNSREYYINSFLAYEYLIVLAYSTLIQDILKIEIDIIYQYKWIIDYGQSKKTKMVKGLYHLFGISLVRTLLGIYLKSRKKYEE